MEGAGHGQDADVFEPDEVRDDLVRIDAHRGVEDLLFHTLSLKRLCAYAVDTRETSRTDSRPGARDPANSGRA